MALTESRMRAMTSTSRMLAAAGALALSLFFQGTALGKTVAFARPPQETAQQHVEKAWEAFRKANYEKSKGEAKRALSLDKETFEAYLLLGMSPPGDAKAATLQAQIEALKGWIEFARRRRDSSYAPPRLLNSPQPRYTEEARRAKVEGTVRLGLLVSETGNVASTLVFLALGFGLDEAAIKVAHSLKFKPATTKDGTAVPFWTMMELEFNLR